MDVAHDGQFCWQVAKPSQDYNETTSNTHDEYDLGFCFAIVVGQNMPETVLLSTVRKIFQNPPLRLSKKVKHGVVAWPGPTMNTV